MKKSTLAILVLCACASAPVEQDAQAADASEPDAGVYVPPDAPPDAPKESGCVMGNLPKSRTNTVDDSDPVPSALLDELQDQFVGDTRTDFYRSGLPFCWVSTAGAPTIVQNPAGIFQPVWHIPSGALVEASIPFFDGGDTINNAYLDLYGNGAVDVVVNIQYSSDLIPTSNTVITTGAININNVPAAWTRYDLDALGVFVPTRLVTGGYLRLALNVSGGDLHLGQVILKLEHIPPAGEAP